MIREGLIREIGKDIVVVGGGISGIETALKLKTLGLDVTLIEKEGELGGILKQIPFVLTHSEVVKTENILSERINRLEKSGINVIKGTSVKEIEGFVGDFTLKLSNGEKMKTSQVVIATGLEYTTKKEEFASSQMDIEALIKQGFPEGAHVCFFIDSTDWGFKLNTVNAFKQALLLMEKFNAKVYMLAKDYKVSFDGGEAIFRVLREKGVTFFKVSEFPRYRRDERKIVIELEDELLLGERQKVTLLVDYIVLPMEARKISGNEKLLKYLRLREYEFYLEENPQLYLYYPSFKKGIYFVGSCTYPMLIEDIELDAARIASGASAINVRIKDEINTPFARVNPEKCALCLTCFRNCPTGSITFKVYPGKKNIYYVPYMDDGRSYEAAYVDPTSCWGCGICVSECPAKAIELVGMEDQEIINQLRG